jgi:hypothetical protein
MQWSAEDKAGFTEAIPWLPIASDYERVNVAAERDDPNSMLTLYSRLIGLRRGEPALQIGRFEPIECDGDVLAYVRRARSGESGFVIALNLGHAHVDLPLDGPGAIALFHAPRSRRRARGGLAPPARRRGDHRSRFGVARPSMWNRCMRRCSTGASSTPAAASTARPQ